MTCDGWQRTDCEGCDWRCPLQEFGRRIGPEEEPPTPFGWLPEEER